MNMAQFFANCGDMINYNIVASGDASRKHFVCHWQYENGAASYNGADWTFTLNVSACA